MCLQALKAWAPIEYKEEGEWGAEGQPQADTQQDNTSAATQATAATAAAGSAAAPASAVAAAAAVATAPATQAQHTGASAPASNGQQGHDMGGAAVGTSGYVSNATPGYYHMSSTRAHYDATTGLYFVPGTNQWCTLDATGHYVPVASGAATAQQPGAGTAEAAQAPGAAEGAAQPTAVAAAGAPPVFTHPPAGIAGLGTSQGAPAAQPAAPPAPAVQAGVPQAASVQRQGAVIGSAPQYNPEGLLLAAQQIAVRTYTHTHTHTHTHLCAP